MSGAITNGQMQNKNPNQCKLFVGTNQNGLIITIDISEWLDFENDVDDVVDDEDR